MTDKRPSNVPKVRIFTKKGKPNLAFLKGLHRTVKEEKPEDEKPDSKSV